MLVEADDQHAVVWTKPDDLDVDLAKPLTGLAIRPPGGFLVLMADGSVHFLRAGMKPATLAALFTRGGRNRLAASQRRIPGAASATQSWTARRHDRRVASPAQDQRVSHKGDWRRHRGTPLRCRPSIRLQPAERAGPGVGEFQRSRSGRLFRRERNPADRSGDRRAPIAGLHLGPRARCESRR